MFTLMRAAASTLAHGPAQSCLMRSRGHLGQEQQVLWLCTRVRCSVCWRPSRTCPLLIWLLVTTAGTTWKDRMASSSSLLPSSCSAVMPSALSAVSKACRQRGSQGTAGQEPGGETQQGLGTCCTGSCSTAATTPRWQGTNRSLLPPCKPVGAYALPGGSPGGLVGTHQASSPGWWGQRR